MSQRVIGAVGPERCLACHAAQGQLSHATQQAEQRFGHGAKADCTSCHAFTLDGSGHDPKLGTAAGQLSELPGSGGHAAALDVAHVEPENEGGAAEFLRGVEPYAPGDCKRCHAVQQGTTPAVTVHGTQQCTSCHRPHQDARPSSAPCSNCHQGIQTTHASSGKTPLQTCVTCHQHQHAPASEARSTCAACHARQQPIIPASALFEGGHRECVGCHRPHEFQSQAVAPCRSCHADLNVLGSGKVPAHNQCTSCHAPHDVRSSPENACKNCHQSVHSDHPKQGVVGTCVGCHTPHPTSPRVDQPKACSSCHQQAASDHDFHGKLACAECHKPHDFVLALSQHQACQACHAKPVQLAATNAGHHDCQGCHRGLPHRPTTLQTGCDSCHAAERARVIVGHSVCTNCHEPHSGSQTKACQSCHKAQQQSAPAGHQLCSNCHQAHSGVATQKPCTACHAAESHGPHGQLATGCLTCHRPHGPSGVAKPPACSSCHQASQLPGLHAQPKHQACERCHSGHGDPPSTAREVCLGCHADRRQHFPDAARCANCHLFTQHR